jgi:adenine phosphoribosyltransferase
MTNPLDRLTRVIPDWPVEGVSFQDLTGVLADAEGLKYVAEQLAAPFRDAGVEVVAGMEARGFIVGVAVARELGVGFVALRKAGKLPGPVHAADYELEYGTATIEVHKEDVPQGRRVLLIDDVLATGGTAAAAVELIERCGAEVVGLGFVLALDFLGGTSRLDGHRIHSLRSIS